MNGKPYLVPLAVIGIEAKELAGTVNAPDIVHSHGDLGQNALNLDELLRAKAIVVDAAVDESPYVASASYDLCQDTTGTLVELA